MKRKNKCLKAGISCVLWGVIATLVCCFPCSAATVGAGDTLNLDYAISDDWLDVYGTLNMNPGAHVDWGIYAFSGSAVNIYAGGIGAGYSIIVSGGATVNVYGINFEDSGGPVGYGEWTPASSGEILMGTYENGTAINLLFYSDIAIHLLEPSVEPPVNQPPVPNAGTDLTVFTKDIATTIINGTATDPDEGDSLQYRWLKGSVEFTLWLDVGENGEAPLNLGDILPEYLGIGTHTLTLEVTDGTDIAQDDMVLTIMIAPVTIDIKPGSYPNSINLGSNGVVPVAILSTDEFDATAIPANTIFLAGSGVAVRGKGNNTLAHKEDINGDGLMDLVVKVETENLEPGTFQDGWAYLRIHASSDQNSPILYEGWDEITIVPPE